jgi:hypothetical protein
LIQGISEIPDSLMKALLIPQRLIIRRLPDKSIPALSPEGDAHAREW